MHRVCIYCKINLCCVHRFACPVVRHSCQVDKINIKIIRLSQRGLKMINDKEEKKIKCLRGLIPFLKIQRPYWRLTITLRAEIEAMFSCIHSTGFHMLNPTFVTRNGPMNNQSVWNKELGLLGRQWCNQLHNVLRLQSEGLKKRAPERATIYSSYRELPTHSCHLSLPHLDLLHIIRATVPNTASQHCLSMHYLGNFELWCQYIWSSPGLIHTIAIDAVCHFPNQHS